MNSKLPLVVVSFFSDLRSQFKNILSSVWLGKESKFIQMLLYRVHKWTLTKKWYKNIVLQFLRRNRDLASLFPFCNLWKKHCQHAKEKFSKEITFHSIRQTSAIAKCTSFLLTSIDCPLHCCRAANCSGVTQKEQQKQQRAAQLEK